MIVVRTARLSFVELLIILVVIGTVGAAAIPRYAMQQEQHLEARMAAAAINAAIAEQRHAERVGSYLTGGECAALPGMVVPDGVNCRLHPRAHGGFLVTLSHPVSPASCTWDSTAKPNLACS